MRPASSPTDPASPRYTTRGCTGPNSRRREDAALGQNRRWQVLQSFTEGRAQTHQSALRLS